MEEFNFEREREAAMGEKKDEAPERAPTAATVIEKLKETPITDLEKLMHPHEMEEGRKHQRKKAH